MGREVLCKMAPYKEPLLLTAVGSISNSLPFHSFISLAKHVFYYATLLLFSLLFRLSSTRLQNDAVNSANPSSSSSFPRSAKGSLVPGLLVDEGTKRSMARRKKDAPPMDINEKCKNCDKVFKRPCDLRWVTVFSPSFLPTLPFPSHLPMMCRNR